MVFRYATSAFALILTLAVLLRLTVVSSVVMSGGAMEPAILPGEFLLATRGNTDAPHRGAVALLTCPGNRTCLKRVAAIPGDRIESRRGQIFVNDAAVSAGVSGQDLEPAIVPPDQIYVLNDQTSDQDDSRTFGPIDLERVEGRARLIWLSLDWFDDRGEVRGWPAVRWSRTFKLVD